MRIADLFQMQDQMTLPSQTNSRSQLKSLRHSAHLASDPTSMALAFQGIARIRQAEGTGVRLQSRARMTKEGNLARPYECQGVSRPGHSRCDDRVRSDHRQSCPSIAAAEAFFERRYEIAPGDAFARQWMGIL